MSLQMMNMFDCTLYYMNGEEPTIYTEAPDDEQELFTYDLFLFSQYPPSQWLAMTRTMDSFTHPFAGISGWAFIEPEPWTLLELSSSLTVDPVVNNVKELRECVIADTKTNTVRVFGFDTYHVVFKRGLTNDVPNNIACSFQHKINGMGASVRSGHYYRATYTNNTMYQQIVMRESDYTQEMSNADNLITYSSGGYDLYYKIVGVWARPS